MGQYKVPQDVEAEDKIIGFLTLKQFIYAIIGVMWLVITFTLLRKVIVLFLVIGLPPAITFLLLGLYQRQGQSFEAYFLALVGYFGRSRQRVWEKEPIAEVFKIEAPKAKIETAPPDPGQVYSQLEHLSHVVDTRGWSAKQPEIQEPAASTALNPTDRLAAPVFPEATKSGIDTSDVTLSDDMLDLQNNPSAQGLTVLIENAVKNIRTEAVTKMKHHRATKAEAKASKPETTSHHRKARVEPPKPDAIPSQASNPSPASASTMTANPLNDILKLAMEDGDLTISQIAAKANKQAPLAEGQAVDLRHAQNSK